MRKSRALRKEQCREIPQESSSDIDRTEERIRNTGPESSASLSAGQTLKRNRMAERASPFPEGKYLPDQIPERERYGTGGECKTISNGRS